ncbi:hypothetical protein [Paenibacillus ferrarius]|uniref:hypothetical protein n=1 Tax=Paenibacillus ferrarius TaxID=1469647 RepID=UPI001301A002|nr:hypothetical protein [Paenibacillus ferrarius]
MIGPKFQTRIHRQCLKENRYTPEEIIIHNDSHMDNEKKRYYYLPVIELLKVMADEA